MPIVTMDSAPRSVVFGLGESRWSWREHVAPFFLRYVQDIEFSEVILLIIIPINFNR